MTIEQRITATLRREPAMFVDLCKVSTAEKWGCTYGEIDEALVGLAQSDRVRFTRGAWVAR